MLYNKNFNFYKKIETSNSLQPYYFLLLILYSFIIMSACSEKKSVDNKLDTSNDELIAQLLSTAPYSLSDHQINFKKDVSLRSHISRR
jgi:hypothetical protein